MINIGTDLCSVDRIRKKLNSVKKEAFLQMIFTEDERKIGEQYKDPAEFYAGRWAVKEAVSKCLKTGFGSSCKWSEINVKRDSLGVAFIELLGVTKKTADEMKIFSWKISISHEMNLAMAFVIAT